MSEKLVPTVSLSWTAGTSIEAFANGNTTIAP